MDSRSQQRELWPYRSSLHALQTQQKVSTILPQLPPYQAAEERFPPPLGNSPANKKPLHLEPFLSSNGLFV